MHPIKHFRTITKHRHTVIRHCAKAGIFWQGLGHDLSKYTPTEFSQGARFYQGTRSPNEGERDERGYSLAWMHHKGRNRHHFEYWTDYNPKAKAVMPVKMPERFVVEMFCDRVAASKTYKGKSYIDRDPLDYFDRGRAQYLMHEDTATLLRHLLAMLAEKGEKETFAYLRRMKKEKKSLYAAVLREN